MCTILMVRRSEKTREGWRGALGCARTLFSLTLTVRFCGLIWG
jgi:hypothetical protein